MLRSARWFVTSLKVAKLHSANERGGFASVSIDRLDYDCKPVRDKYSVAVILGGMLDQSAYGGRLIIGCTATVFLLFHGSKPAREPGVRQRRREL